jgi:hypothetical protein
METKRGDGRGVGRPVVGAVRGESKKVPELGVVLGEELELLAPTGA